MSEQATRRVVLLDDDPVWMRSLSRLLELRAGVECICFPSPASALAFLEYTDALHDAPLLCVIDFMLGDGWTGARFARAVRKQLGERTPPLVCVSGSLEDVSLEDLCPFDGALPKSLEAEDLVRQLSQFVGSTGEAQSYVRLSHTDVQIVVPPGKESTS